jgi:hypothetical protein
MSQQPNKPKQPLPTTLERIQKESIITLKMYFIRKQYKYYTQGMLLDEMQRRRDLGLDNKMSSEEVKLQFEKEELRKKLLEKERKRQLKNDVIKSLWEEGNLKRKTFNQPKREPIPQDIMDQVWNRDGGKCVKCGSQENLEFDHIIPHSKGGATSYRNLQILCKSCNIEKSNKIG